MYYYARVSWKNVNLFGFLPNKCTYFTKNSFFLDVSLKVYLGGPADSVVGHGPVAVGSIQSWSISLPHYLWRLLGQFSILCA